MGTNQPWNWRLTVLKTIKVTWHWSGHYMTNFKMIFRDDCAVSSFFFFSFWPPRPGIRFEPHFWPKPQLQQHQILKLLCPRAGDWTCVSMLPRCCWSLCTTGGNSKALAHLLSVGVGVWNQPLGGSLHPPRRPASKIKQIFLTTNLASLLVGLRNEQPDSTFDNTLNL